MNKITFIYRKPNQNNFSIERVFGSLLPEISKHFVTDNIIVPRISKGIINPLINIITCLKIKSSISHLTGDIGYAVCALKKPVVLTIHDCVSFHRLKLLKKYIFKTIWYNFPISRATAITTVSEFSKKEIKKFTCTKKEIVVIPNCVTIPIQSVHKDFNEKRPRILFIGSTPNKNLSNTITALKGLSIELLVIGKINNTDLNKLSLFGISYINKNNLSNSQMLEEYKNSDLLLFPSFYEGFGLPVLEAQAIGLPVITSNICSMPEFAGEGALLVDPYDPKSIREAVVAIQERKNVRKQIVEKGKKNILEYSAEKIAKKYVLLYESLLK